METHDWDKELNDYINNNALIKYTPMITKIAYALKDLGFQGNLYVIDTNTEVLEYINEKYNSILPNAKIICINKSFEIHFISGPFMNNKTVEIKVHSFFI